MKHSGNMMFCENFVNTDAVDALAPCITRSSASTSFIDNVCKIVIFLSYKSYLWPLAEPKCDFARLYQSISINLNRKKTCFWLILLKNTCAYSFMWIAIHWVYCIDTYHSDKMLVHQWIIIPLPTPHKTYVVLPLLMVEESLVKMTSDECDWT